MTKSAVGDVPEDEHSDSGHDAAHEQNRYPVLPLC